MRHTAMMRTTLSMMLAILVPTPLAAAQAVEYDVQVFEPLGRQPSTYATAMNEQGLIVGYAGEVRFDSLATPLAIYQGRMMEGAKPGDSLNYPLGIGASDLVVGTSSTFPIVWKRGRPHLLAPSNGLPQGEAFDANESGVICGYVVRDFTGAQFPTIWRNYQVTGLRLRGLGTARQGIAYAINEQHQVAGSIREVAGFGFVAVRWDRADRPPLPLGVLPGAINSEGLAINNLGDVAGRSSFADNSIQAFVYIDATQSLQGLGDLGGGYSYARGINDLQQVVGESSIDGEIHGFVWQDETMRDLNDLVRNTNEPFLYIANAVAIDSRGRIAAEVLVQDGPNEASRIALLTPVP